MNEKRNILIIAYYFPPLGLSGVQRTLKFVKYLPQFGWKPTVLTITPTGYFAQDYSLLEEIKDIADIEIVRVGSLDPNFLFRKKENIKMPSEFVRKLFQFTSDFFFIPDNKIFWRKKVLKKADALFQEKKFEIIFATAPPWTDFLIGMELRYKYNVPLVVDYRDSWMDNPFKYFPTPFHYFLNLRKEKKIIRASSKIFTTNRKVKELILKKHLRVQYNDIHILSQGFDKSDFPNENSKRSDNKMRITHAGIFYGKRTPNTFLIALKNLFAKNTSLKNKIEVEFIGKERSNEKKLIEKLKLQENVKSVGYLQHKECVQKICESDILFIAVDNNSQSPGKLYEYFGSKKPILANVSNGYLKHLIEESKVGFVVDLNDVENMEKRILELFHLFEKNNLPKGNDEFVSKFEREKLTQELSRILGFLSFE